MFGINRRAREDEKRILEANRSFEEVREDEAEVSEKLPLEKGDLPAMILAALSLIVPYVLLFLLGLIAFFFLLQLLW